MGVAPEGAEREKAEGEFEGALARRFDDEEAVKLAEAGIKAAREKAEADIEAVVVAAEA